jgi:hypothetical protein
MPSEYEDNQQRIDAEQRNLNFLYGRLFEAIPALDPNLVKCHCGHEKGFHYNDFKVCGVYKCTCRGFKA